MRSVDFCEETGVTRPEGGSFGFTLIELLLVIIIMSAITMAVAYSAQRAIDKVNFENAQQMAKNIDTALEYFRLKALRLPCPAQRGVAQNAANYGREDCAWSDTNSVPSNRTSYPVSVSAIDNKVYIGNLPIYVQETAGGPWVSLASYVPALDKVGSAKFLDATGNPPLYAVAKKLTAASGASGGDFGNIQIVDENNNPVAGVNNDARYVVVLQTYRGGGCVVGNKDHENCDLSNDKFVIAPRALNTASASYFDDVVLFGNQITDQRWLSNETSLITSPIDSSTQTRGLVYADDNARNVGVGITRPSEKLEVVGGLQAETNVRAPLLCDSPDVVVQTNSANQTINFNFAVDSADIVVKKISGGTTTTLTLTADYTITGSSGAWIINLVAPPALTDTIRVEKWTCLDPLSVTSAYVPYYINTSQNRRIDGLSCSSLDSFSTSSLRSAGSSVWGNAAYLTSGNPHYQDNTWDQTQMNISATPLNVAGHTYYKMNFRRPHVHIKDSKFNLNTNLPGTQGRLIYLSDDPTNPTDPFTGVPELQVAPANRKVYRVFKTLCEYYNTDGNPATNCIDTDCQWSPAPPPRCNGGNGGMETLLVEPLDGIAPVTQNYVAYQVTNIVRYLKGVTVDKNGMMQPVCGNLEITTPTAATNCGSHQLRGVWTKETVVSGVSQGVGICN